MNENLFLFFSYDFFLRFLSHFNHFNHNNNNKDFDKIFVPPKFDIA